MFSLNDLTENLNIERLDRFLFRGCSLDHNLPRVFGGQVLAQSLNAANRSVDQDRRPHSMHAYFLRPGNVNKQIIYEVDPIRDGKSFSTRRVVAKQDGIPIFNASISFHRMEEDQYEHQMDLDIDLIDPETLETDQSRYEAIKAAHPELPQLFYFPSDVIDVRTPRNIDPFDTSEQAPIDGFWFKVRGSLDDDPIMHRTMLAFISDKRLMGTGIRPHPVTFVGGKLMVASLDHSLWFHGDVRVDQWLYYHMDSPKAGRARTFSRGSFYTQDGALIASAAQEGLFRTIQKNAP